MKHELKLIRWIEEERKIADVKDLALVTGGSAIIKILWMDYRVMKRMQYDAGEVGREQNMQGFLGHDKDIIFFLSLLRNSKSPKNFLVVELKVYHKDMAGFIPDQSNKYLNKASHTNFLVSQYI